MSKPSPQEPPKKKNQPKTPPSPKSSTPPVEAADIVLSTLKQMCPGLLEFHTASKAAAPNDLQLYWDVRLVDSEGKPYANSSGVSSLPGALGDKKRLSGMIEQEIENKVARPFAARAQELLQDDVFRQEYPDALRLPVATKELDAGLPNEEDRDFPQAPEVMKAEAEAPVTKAAEKPDIDSIGAQFAAK